MFQAAALAAAGVAGGAVHTGVERGAVAGCRARPPAGRWMQRGVAALPRRGAVQQRRRGLQVVLAAAAAPHSQALGAARRPAHLHQGCREGGMRRWGRLQGQGRARLRSPTCVRSPRHATIRRWVPNEMITFMRARAAVRGSGWCSVSFCIALGCKGGSPASLAAAHACTPGAVGRAGSGAATALNAWRAGC